MMVLPFPFDVSVAETDDSHSAELAQGHRGVQAAMTIVERASDFSSRNPPVPPGPHCTCVF